VWQNLAPFGGRLIGGAVEALWIKVVNRRLSVLPIVVFFVAPRRTAVSVITHPNSAESIILSASGTESIMLSALLLRVSILSAPAESIIVSAPPAETMILSALPTDTTLKHTGTAH
jgi:hypothetical protein